MHYFFFNCGDKWIKNQKEKNIYAKNELLSTKSDFSHLEIFRKKHKSKKSLFWFDLNEFLSNHCEIEVCYVFIYYLSCA